MRLNRVLKVWVYHHNSYKVLLFLVYMNGTLAEKAGIPAQFPDSAQNLLNTLYEARGVPNGSDMRKILVLKPIVEASFFGPERIAFPTGLNLAETRRYYEFLYLDKSDVL